MVSLSSKNFHGCARHVYNWNWALSESAKHYEATGKGLSKRAIQGRLVASKKSEKAWLNEVNSQNLLAPLANLDKAFANFFKGLAKFLRYKKKYSGYPSFQCPQHVTVDSGMRVINLPKIKDIKAKLHCPLSGEIKTVTVREVFCQRVDQ